MTATSHLWTPPPSGHQLAHAVSWLLRNQSADAISAIRHGRKPDLSRWTSIWIDVLRPILSPYYSQGANQLLRRIRQNAPQRMLPTMVQRAYARKSFRVRRWTKDEGSAKRGVFDFAFDLFNPRIKTAVDQAIFEFCEATNATSIGMIDDAMAALRRSLKTGLERGEATVNLNARVYRIFNDPYRAARIGQTETSRAVHGGQFMAAKESGVIKGKRWVASSDACPSCLKLNGNEVALDEPFVVLPKGGPYAVIMHPPLHPHCLLGETPIVAPGAISATKSNYCGPAIRIVLSSGDSFTCTPNHMLLTPHGFARAKALMKGDDVVYCPARQGGLGGSPNDDRKPTRIDEVVASLAESSGMASVSVPVSSEYLHGDAAFCQGQINVVTSSGLLLNDFADVGCLEHFQEFDFDGRDVGQIGLLSDGHLDAMLGASEMGPLGVAGMPLRDVLGSIAVSLDGCMGSHREFFADALRRSSVTGQLSEFHGPKVDAFFTKPMGYHGPGYAQRLGNRVDRFSVLVSPDNDFDVDLGSKIGVFGPERDAGLAQPRLDGVLAYPNRLRDTIDRLPGQITTCKILDVQVFHFDGPVYDVETESSLYIIGSGAVSSNCFCSWSEVFGTPQSQSGVEDLFDAPLKFHWPRSFMTPAGMPSRLAASIAQRLGRF